MPNVFVACPYDEKTFGYSRFKRELEHLPFKIEYADTNLETKHLLERIKRLINSNDFSFFDLSMWNPNVALELGLADGLKADYYILVNSKLDKEVPSDVKGIQRIQYLGLQAGDRSLRGQIIQYFFKRQLPLTRDLWNTLSRRKNASKKYDFALRVLAFLRDHDAVEPREYREISRGLYVRRPDQDEAVRALLNIGALRKVRNRNEYRLKKEIYKQ